MYDTLTPAERATLVLEAKARGDVAEAERLTGSCPQKHYRQYDAAFSDRLDLSFDKSAAAAMVLLHHQGKLEVLQGVKGCVEGFSSCWRLGTAMGFFDGMNYADDRHPPADALVEQAKRPPVETEADDDPGPEFLAKLQMAMGRVDGAADQLLELLKNTAEEVARDLLEAWSAYGWFARSCVGLEPDKLMAAWGFPIGMATSIEESLAPYPHLKPRDAETTQLAEALSRAWWGRFGE
jgi:hypothetical protein